MNRSFTYTASVVHNARFTVNDAIDAARAILTDKKIRQVNLDSVRNRDPKEKITLLVLNQITDQIVTDSMSW